MIKHINRYGDRFTFELNDRGRIQWSGEFTRVRHAINGNTEELTMVDPSGGPAIYVGTDMSVFGLSGEVTRLCRNDSGYEITISKQENDELESQSTKE